MKLSDINNIKLLSNYLKIDKSILDEICANDYIDLSIRDYVLSRSKFEEPTLVIQRIEIFKKNGGVRTVYSPMSDSVINCLKILNKKLNDLYKPPKNVYGFVKGRSVKLNASEHLSKKYVLKLDIKNYFESIKTDMLKKAFLRLGFNNEIIDCLCNIVTHNNCLVQGFHTSPTLANIVFFDLDKTFDKISENITYTRYADDLYFSSNDEFEIFDFVEKTLKKNSFDINYNKTRMMKRGGKQFVTGLTVFDSNFPRISKRVKKDLRQEIYFIKKFGYKGHALHKLKIKNEDYENNAETKGLVDAKIFELKQRINGWLIYINSIEPKFANKYSEFLYKKSFKD